MISFAMIFVDDFISEPEITFSIVEYRKKVFMIIKVVSILEKLKVAHSFVLNKLPFHYISFLHFHEKKKKFN